MNNVMPPCVLKSLGLVSQFRDINVMNLHLEIKLVFIPVSVDFGVFVEYMTIKIKYRRYCVSFGWFGEKCVSIPVGISIDTDTKKWSYPLSFPGKSQYTLFNKQLYSHQW
jgi:hypothetical protein